MSSHGSILSRLEASWKPGAIHYTLEAARGLEAAVAWYDEARPGLGRALLDEVASAEAAILRSPRAFRVVHRGTRRYLLRRFPFQLLFRQEREEIVIASS